MKEDTDEMKIINEMKKVDENISNYIDNTMSFLMKYGMSQQDACVSIIKQFNKILEGEKND